MRHALLLTAALLLGAPAVAVAQPVGHTHQTASGQGIEATFHVDAPGKPLYTCAMHPEVIAAKPGKCPECHMVLEKQTHRVGVQLRDGSKKPLQGALVRLTLKDEMGMIQGLDLKGNGFYEGAFHLVPGTYQMTAFVKRKQAAQAVALTVSYEAK